MTPWRPLPAVVAALLVLSGCAAVGTGSGGGDGGGGTGIAGQTPGLDGSLVPNAGNATATAREVEVIGATVVEVVDGDTLDVRYRDGTADTVRLLGVDTPEVHTDTDPAEFEGVPDTEAGRRCLRSAGEAASAAVTDRLAGADVRLIVDPTADRRGGYDRLLAYVVHDGRNVNYRLVVEGHARVYDSTFRYAEAFYAAERTARNRSVGLWQCTDGSGSRVVDP